VHVASITQQPNGKWRAQIFVKGDRDTKVFDTKEMASAWAAHMEASMRKRSDLKQLMAAGVGIPNFPRRIIQAMSDAPLSDVDIVRQSTPSSTVSGIYFLIRDGRIIYIGQSTNTLRRIARHIDDGKIFDSFTIAPCNRDELNKMERIYITALCPEENMTFGNAEPGMATCK
jgi:hypothetical protein